MGELACITHAMCLFCLPQLVNEVLRDLNSDPKCHGNFVLVRLSGLVHVDNHQALLGIAAQLDLKDQLEQCVKVGLVIHGMNQEMCIEWIKNCL